MKKFIESYAAWIALFLLLILCAATCESFRIPANYAVMLRQACYTGIIAVGMTFVIGSGGIDLSVGSLFALSGVIAFKLAPFCCTSPAGQFLCLIAIALAAGAAGGALNGALAGFAKLPPFIVTLGTMSIFRSLRCISEMRAGWDSTIPCWQLLTVILQSGYLFLPERQEPLC